MLTDCRSAAVVVCSDVCANALATLVKISVTAKSPLTKRFITKSLQDELTTRTSALRVRTRLWLRTCGGYEKEDKSGSGKLNVRRVVCGGWSERRLPRRQFHNCQPPAGLLVAPIPSPLRLKRAVHALQF